MPFAFDIDELLLFKNYTIRSLFNYSDSICDHFEKLFFGSEKPPDYSKYQSSLGTSVLIICIIAMVLYWAVGKFFVSADASNVLK
jgi:hypothetical protein